MRWRCFERRSFTCASSFSPSWYTMPFLARVYRHDLARIRAMLWVEHAAQLAHRVKRSLGEDRLHVTHLVESNAVLTGDASTRRNTRPHARSHRLVYSLAAGRIIG